MTKENATFRVSQELWSKFKLVCNINDKSRGEVLREKMKNYIDDCNTDLEYDHSLNDYITCISWEGSLPGENREVLIILAEWANGTYPRIVRNGFAIGNGDEDFKTLTEKAQKKANQKLKEKWKELGKDNLFKSYFNRIN